MICPLCGEKNLSQFDEDKFRTYHLCLTCSLVSVPREKILPFDDEAKRYDAHENDASDTGYRAYLTQTAEAIRGRVSKKARGLDFGCGRTLLMAKILGSYGHHVDSYDLYFHPKEEVWKGKYDYILLSEVIEHLRDPAGVMLKLKELLSPGGFIFVKTKWYPPDSKSFHNWFYKRDQTHVQFFDYQSMKKLGEMLEMQGPDHLPAPDLYEFRS